jgi:RHH-type proline utilization regulon transcriptional repressor/proline dehydrogenase/delta 1-pyrroline-5-carboxylate dehydrogenase
MNSVVSTAIVMPEENIEADILDLGREIFQTIGKNSPSAFNKNFWAAKMMAWSMTQPDLKTNLFRLVDVLPALKSRQAVVEHVALYLQDALVKLHPILGWGLKGKPKSLRALIVNFAVLKGVRQMAGQFIAGESPQSALKELKRIRSQNLAMTVDLLGEYSVSEKEALAYLDRYRDCLTTFGDTMPKWKNAKPIIAGHPGESSPVCISVKLSALYSQCSPLNMKKSVAVLSDRLSQIVDLASQNGALLYVDAEDTANNPIIYETFREVFLDPRYRSFPYPGIVVQGYTKDSLDRINWLVSLARERKNPLAVRLVKGAYWDNETISAKQQSWESPLFSKKRETDANYEMLSRVMLDNVDHLLPAFGSHNVRSLSHACCYAKSRGVSEKQFELQMLYGMAEPIARAFSAKGYLVRLYVPLGELIPGMGYLVRRLLENTSNESFLRHTFFDQKSVDELLENPANV